ncbi:Hypothetical predicted protein [Paramuricea clavata]|uniref:Uncharacterized protein n=1 Tax=Paramuricea clavata TaxID=317549 RepID=A0A7D9IDK7_PARCT|nr:Hypothetical predicted protein [Paramuricea clavata]
MHPLEAPALMQYGEVVRDLAAQAGASIHDGISSEHTVVCYSRVDDAISMIKKLRKSCFLAKTDIKNAFHIISICPQDYDLLGIFWQGEFYYDRAMPMGCASSCRRFEMFSTAMGCPETFEHCAPYPHS